MFLVVVLNPAREALVGTEMLFGPGFVAIIILIFLTLFFAFFFVVIIKIAQKHAYTRGYIYGRDAVTKRPFKDQL